MHGRHDAELLSGWWKPLGHAVQVSAFWFAEKRPAAHTTHVSSVLFRCFPALHSEQDALPLPAVRPEVHFLQAVSSTVSEYVLTVQSLHSSCPAWDCALPGTQGKQ